VDALRITEEHTNFILRVEMSQLGKVAGYIREREKQVRVGGSGQSEVGMGKKGEHGPE
jgi:hypothetical protein